ncbi:MULTISPECIES: carbohydrate ABC transporter permease [Bacillaceae]|uniref:Sugar ABC transporter ATP-binding protein n=3 Tax=Bacillaceae TaxID=186817 RepID=A0A9D5DR41_9BACI|nr:MULTISPECIES: carbohydrate ABC transporter permease [Bacillaceae]KQL58576.1 sugar ABC transporter ATP-binding protein [Alkalicoccobacillus plakortidis]MED4128474.1 carbohydrate ABC transporter permease [Shouchella miscanthi]WDF02110.1 carbohydrate ABC transporter permease [Shouchella hunanensis]GAF22940.1 ABC-type sugar transport system, permease component [Bacillus sp. JCM 19047]
MKINSMSTLIRYLLLTMISAIMLLPFIWMVTTSLKDPNQIFSLPPTFIPNPIQWDSYINVLTSTYFLRQMFNSIYIGAAVTIGTVFLASLAGYAFARIPFKGRNLVFLAFLSVMMIPGEVTIIPLFLFMRELGWIDTHWPLIIIPIFGAGGAFGIFVMRQFFKQVPAELEDAARIDGCSRFRIFLQIMLPLSKPALATVTIFTFLTNWNEFLEPLIFINSRELMTLPLALSLFTDEAGTDWSSLMSASVLATLPVLVIFFFAQKQFIESLAMSGSKE